MTYSSSLFCIFYKLYQYAIRYLRSSKIVTRFLFSVGAYQSKRQVQWDFTTLVLKKALDKYIKNGEDVLEMGTGPFAILSTYLAKKKQLNIVAVDINPVFVEEAKENIKQNHVFIEVFQSNLFSQIKGIFDVIFFNPPYIPTYFGKKHSITKLEKAGTDVVFDLTWNGGPQGCNTIVNFLEEAPQFLKPNGMILLGVNEFYISTGIIKEIITKADFSLMAEVTSFLNPGKVYVLKRKRSPLSLAKGG